jgi:hypothetical protein
MVEETMNEETKEVILFISHWAQILFCMVLFGYGVSIVTEGI